MGDSIDIQQTMTESAMDTLDMKIRCDPSLKVLNKSEVSLWRTRLSHLQIARLVSQYFGKRHDEKKTLAEMFSKVKFQYLMIFIINAILELDFGEDLGQGLLLIVSLAKVLACQDGRFEGATVLSSTGKPPTC